jgi:hypothetical protein
MLHRAREYFLARLEGKPSRFDAVLGALFIFAAMAAISFGWERNWARMAIWGSGCLLLLVFSRYRMAYVAAALFFMGFRLAILPNVLRGPGTFDWKVFVVGVGSLLGAVLLLKWSASRIR